MQFTRMPQGFKNSLNIPTAMNMIFAEVIGNVCVIYIDDILVYGKSKREHDENLKKARNLLNGYNLKENIEKRKGCVTEITFLAYKISKNTIKPTLERALGVIGYERPKKTKVFRNCKHDRIFIKNLSLLKPVI